MADVGVDWSSLVCGTLIFMVFAPVFMAIPGTPINVTAFGVLATIGVQIAFATPPASGNSPLLATAVL